MEGVLTAEIGWLVAIKKATRNNTRKEVTVGKICHNFLIWLCLTAILKYPRVTKG
jgi:hypothetical protein